MDELIRVGLSEAQKKLPAALLYDDLGSALFEAITHLPEYEVARVDTALLEANIDEALSLLGTGLDVVELGPGHGRKAERVLERLISRQGPTRFVAVDVSSSALEACQRRLEHLQSLEVVTVEASFIEGLLKAGPRVANRRRLVMFLGSNLSNFERSDAIQFLRDVRRALAPGDSVLLSADLEKPPARLLPAYEDALGVTAAFNRNVLRRLNREYGANFEVTQFAHEARWNAHHRRVEMHLRALTEQQVRVPRLELDLRFRAGETVWTESSHRFNLDELCAWGMEAQLSPTRTWVYGSWPLALSLFVAT